MSKFKFNDRVVVCKPEGEDKYEYPVWNNRMDKYNGKVGFIIQRDGFVYQVSFNDAGIFLYNEKWLKLESIVNIENIENMLYDMADVSLTEILPVINRWYRSRRDRKCLLVGDRVTFTKDAVGHHEYGDTGTIVKKKSFEGDFLVKIDGMQGEYLYYTNELILM